MITPSSESTTTTTVSSSCIMNTAAAADHTSENRFSIANCAIESNNRTTSNERVATHQCTHVDRQPILPSQQRTVRYINHEHHITDQYMTSSLSIQTINSNKAEVQIRKEEEEEEEDFDKHNLLIGRRLHRIKRRLFLQLTVPSIPPTLLTSNLLSSSSASSCCSTTSLVLTVE